MSVELVEKVHDGVSLEGRAAYYHVLLALGSVGRVRTAQFLAFHPSECQLLELDNRNAPERNY